MKIMHFDVKESDKFYVCSSEESCMKDSFSEKTAIYDETVVTITGTHASYFGKNTLNCFPNLKKIITRTSGYDNMDIKYLSSQGITCLSIGSYGPQTVALHILSLLLYGLRDLWWVLDNIKLHQIFTCENLSPSDIEWKILWVIGVGSIGKSLIKMCQGFGLKIVGHDISPDERCSLEYNFTYISLNELLRQSDFIVLACNLTEDNRNMINNESLKLVKDGVILINCARGALIDEKALIQHINKFKFVWLDTICQENELWIKKLTWYKNIFISPHMAHLSESTIKKRWDMTYDLI